MDRKRLLVAFAVVAVALASVIALLVTGEAVPLRSFEDPAGDPAVEEGKKPPTDTTLADIRNAEVTDDGDEIVLETQLGTTVPKEVDEGSFGLRWEIYEGGDSTYLITANLDVGPNASIIGEQTGYGASTLDETLPGSLEVVGDRIAIRIDPDGIPEFPDEFEWVVTTTLDGDQGDPQSARAEDRAPDQGYGEYPVEG